MSFMDGGYEKIDDETVKRLLILQKKGEKGESFYQTGTTNRENFTLNRFEYEHPHTVGKLEKDPHREELVKLLQEVPLYNNPETEKLLRLLYFDNTDYNKKNC